MAFNLDLSDEDTYKEIQGIIQLINHNDNIGLKVSKVLSELVILVKTIKAELPLATQSHPEVDQMLKGTLMAYLSKDLTSISEKH